MTPRHPGSRRVNRRIVAAAAAAVLAGPVIALTASASDTAPPAIVAVTAVPADAVKVTSSTGTATFTLSARITDDAGVVRAFAGLSGPGGVLPEGRGITLSRTAGTAKDGTWTKQITMKRSDPVGTWQVRAFAQDGEGNMSDVDKVVATFGLKDATRFTSFNVGPEPATVGGKLTLAGRLQRYVPGTGWIAYSGKTVRLEFRAAGTTAYVPVVTRKTNSTGSFATSSATTVTGSGSWRMVFPGSSTRAPSTSGSDTVLVG
jgi:hypothetical protein